MEFKSSRIGLFSFRLRVVVAGLLILVCFGLVASRYVYLQVYRHDYYSTRAENNRIALVPIPPNRGLILDRNGVVLAHNYSAHTLEITPSKVRNLNAIIDALATFIPISKKDRIRFQRLREGGKKYESIPIRLRLTDEEVARFTAQRYRFPGVDVKARLFRQYPYGAFAAHAIGYVGRIDEKDINSMEKDEEKVANYRGTDIIGRAGLERFYEDELHGTTGFEQIEVDASGRAVRVLSRTLPKQGANLVLTLDIGLQRVAEQAFRGRRGALVAIDPKTGDILAMVSAPSYDLNLFADSISSQNWNELNDSEDRPMINRAINAAYPPGSTFKPFMALAALESGKRHASQPASESINDVGYFDFGKNRFRDDKAGGHGIVNLYKSIVVSCDTYYYMLANDMGIDLIASSMSQFGFGEQTGVDLPSEYKGVLPSRQWKQKRFRKVKQKKWLDGDTISIGIGQGYNTYTPIQLANATAILASGGLVFKPHLVKYIEEENPGRKRVIDPVPVRNLGLKPENVNLIRRAMVGVNKEGTGARVFAGADYDVAGKTGTAQVFSLKGSVYQRGTLRKALHDHALYIAFAPAEDPKIALAVLVENGGFGAESAAPIARQALDYYLLGKKPADFVPLEPEVSTTP